MAPAGTGAAVQLRPATMTDAELLFAWTNDPDTRAASFSTEPVEWAGHVAWLERVLIDPDRRLWIGESDGPVGQVRLDRGDDCEIISVSIAPERRGQGLAALLIQAACAQAYGRVVAEIKPGNVRSVRAFDAAGFKADGPGRWVTASS